VKLKFLSLVATFLNAVSYRVVQHLIVTVTYGMTV